MAIDGASTHERDASVRDPLELFHPPRRATNPPPPPFTFIVMIDDDEACISSDAKLTLRALREDVMNQLQFTGLMQRLGGPLKPGRVICAIVAASQFLRKQKHETLDEGLARLINDCCHFIIIDDRQIYLPKDKPLIDANELTKLEAKGCLVTAPALREDAETGIKRSSLIKDIKLHYLLHQIFDQVQPTHP